MDNVKTEAASIWDSDVARDFRNERQIAEIASALGWSVVQSYYYNDPITNKKRELDVHAMKFAKPNRSSLLYPHVHAHLLIEYKSIEDYHVLFNDVGEPMRALTPKVWLGEYRRESLIEKIEQFIPSRDIQQFLTEFDSLSHPHGHAVISHKGISRKSPISATSFREFTNPSHKSKIRDLENSVLWKAIQSLFSALSSLKSQIEETSLSWIFPHDRISAHTRSHIEDIASTVKNYLLVADYIHPICVIRSKMWMMCEDFVRRVHAVRLHIVNHTHSGEWVDIVSAEYANKFINDITKVYDDTLNSFVPRTYRRAMTLWPELELSYLK
jgi:hypothetical protein